MSKTDEQKKAPFSGGFEKRPGMPSSLSLFTFRGLFPPSLAQVDAHFVTHQGMVGYCITQLRRILKRLYLPEEIRKKPQR